MYYVILMDKTKDIYCGRHTNTKGINNAHHFSQADYESNQRLIAGLKWIFIKILDDGTKIEMS